MKSYRRLIRQLFKLDENISQMILGSSPFWLWWKKSHSIYSICKSWGFKSASLSATTISMSYLISGCWRGDKWVSVGSEDDISHSFFSPESLADALLNRAWRADLGDDKVGSLISRVAVSVAQVHPEDEYEPIMVTAWTNISPSSSLLASSQ